MLKKLKKDLVFRIIIILSLIGSLFVYLRQEDLSTCTARWANNFTAASSIRGVANTNRIDTLNRLIVDIISAPNSEATSVDLNNLLTALSGENEEAREVAAQQYLSDVKARNTNPKVLQDTQAFLKSEADYTTAIAAHPVPDPPKEVC